MVRLVAKGALRYASRDIADGCEFEASDKDAFILRSVGKAVDCIRRDLTPQTTESEPERVVFADEKLASLDEFDAPVRKKRQYRRRDLQVEA